MEGGCPHPPRASRRAYWLLGLLLLLGAMLRGSFYERPYGHPDETITVEVVGYMRRSGDWDTNWARANLEPLLRYDQYNFSSHLYATYFFYRGVKLWPGTAEWRSAANGLPVYRFFSVLLAVVVIVQTWCLARRGLGSPAALLAAALVAVAPILVQDAHYARPEAFVTVLTLATVGWCWPRPQLSAGRVLMAAFGLGLLVAAKISMLLLGFVLLVPILAATTGPRKTVGALLPFAMALGFICGAPGAVVHPAAFANGVRHLTEQYAGLHPPHSHFDGGMVADLLIRYTGATFGWAAIAAFLVGGVTLARTRRWPELGLLVGPVVVFAGYFATRSVFFERNLSHVVPLFLIVAALGVCTVAEEVRQRFRLCGRSGWIATTLLFGLLVLRPLEVTGRLVGLEFSGQADGRHAAFEQTVRSQYPEAGWLSTLFLAEAQLDEVAAELREHPKPLLVRVSDYHDDFTREYLRQFLERFDARKVAEDPGTFPDLPPCTLLTYHRSREHYFIVHGIRRTADR